MTGKRRYATLAQASVAVFEWIEVWIQRGRSHSSLGHLSPEAFEAAKRARYHDERVHRRWRAPVWAQTRMQDTRTLTPRMAKQIGSIAGDLNQNSEPPKIESLLPSSAPRCITARVFAARPVEVCVRIRLARDK